MSSEPAKIRIDYRSRFISLLKKIFGSDDFSKESARPYTFAVYFGKEARIRGEHFTGVKGINFRFSTGDSVVVARFYNGILRLKKEDYVHSIGTGKFYIELIKPEKERTLNGLFKTLSPIVVERIGYSNPKDPKDRYITPLEKGFEESLLENVMRRYEAILGKELKVNSFRFEPIRVKKEVIKHYGGVIRGFIGTFKLVSDSENVLRFIYQYGLGLRTGQGFGYVEVKNGKAHL